MTLYIQMYYFSNMKTTIKDIKEHAKAIKDNGVRSKEAWDRLDHYLRQFDNISFEGIFTVIRTRQGIYRRVMSNEIVKSIYFL